MKINFRQGIVRRQTDIAGNASFLQKHTLTGDYIDLVVSPDPTILTFSHGAAEYLVQENKTVQKAWGPLQAVGQTQYLYWDLSLLDGSLTRGFTLLPPLYTGSKPNTPQNDQHWFDTSTNQMQVWNGFKWVVKVRLFAATYDHNAIIIPFQPGTQSSNNNPIDSGYILLGNNAKPLRQSDGTYVTTETELIVSRGASHAVKFSANLNFAAATEYMSRFSLVSHVAPGKIALASHLNTARQVNGIITEDLYQDEVGNVIESGNITYEQWNWPNAVIGKPLFCGPTGQVTLTPPPMGISQQIGIVKDTDTIQISILNPVIL